MGLPRGFGAFLSTVAAGGGAIAFGVWALWGSGSTACDTAGCWSEPPLAGGALSGVLLVWLPAGACLATGWLLHRYCSRGSRWSRAAAAAIVVLAFAFCFLAALSIGPLLLPVALLLFVAVAATPAPANLSGQAP